MESEQQALSQTEIELLSEIKQQSESLNALLVKVRDHIEIAYTDAQERDRLREAEPTHWLRQGWSRLQEGMMLIERAVEKRTGF